MANARTNESASRCGPFTLQFDFKVAVAAVALPCNAQQLLLFAI